MSNESWQRARATAEAQGWLLTSVQARTAGLLPSEIRSALRGKMLCSLYPGVYFLDPDIADELPAEIWWEAALLAEGPDTCLIGWTAARAIGAQGLPAVDPSIDLALIGGGSRHPRATEAPFLNVVDGPPVIVRQWPLRSDEIDELGRLRVRRSSLTVVDAALLLDRVHALCLFDWALRAGVHTEESLGAGIAAAKRRPGIVHARKMAEIADGRAGSPLESRVRLACIDGDVAPDELQYEVIDHWDRIVAIGDLAWLKKRERPLLAEADGEEEHSKPRAVLHDRRRGNALVVGECDVLRFTWADAMRPVYIQQTVRSALAA